MKKESILSPSSSGVRLHADGSRLLTKVERLQNIAIGVLIMCIAAAGIVYVFGKMFMPALLRLL